MVPRASIQRRPPSKHRRPTVTFGAGVLPAVLLASLFLTVTSRVLLEKVTGSQLVHNFPAFYGTRKFSAPFTGARRQSIF